MELTSGQVDTILQIAGVVAKKYRRRCWWASYEDMEQEAVAQQLAAAKNFDPSYGTRFGAYMWRVAVLSLRNYLLRNSSPVSATNDGRQIANLARLMGAPINDETLASEGNQQHLLEQAEFAGAVRARLEVLLGKEDAAVVIAVLSKEYKREEAAELLEQTVEQVTATVRRGRAKVFDEQLYAMWRDG